MPGSPDQPDSLLDDARRRASALLAELQRRRDNLRLPDRPGDELEGRASLDRAIDSVRALLQTLDEAARGAARRTEN